MKSRSRWLVIGLAVLCLAALTAGLAVAFGGGDGGNSSTGSGASGGQPTSGQTSSPSPDATAACTGDPSFDFGQTICITSAGVRPRVLVSIVGRTVTWRNTTSRPQSIRFLALNGRSGRIPPGGSWTYTPQLPLSIAYRSSSGRGLNQIQVLAQE